MVPDEKICFIVSPLGEQLSDERTHADTVLNLIIEPALEPYRFRPIRGDQITQTGRIDDQIVDLIHNAPLCIIIMSGSNPNVFYECGRRHATGKPYIHLLKKGEKAPFDVAGIRYCTYDLTDGFTIRDSVKTLRSFIEEYESAGYGTSSSSVSLYTISERLDRIESSLKRIYGSNAPAGVVEANLTDVNPLDRLRMMQEPFDYAIKAILNGDVQTFKTLLPIVERRYANTPKNILVMYSYAVKAGETYVIDRAIQLLERNYESLDILSIRSGLIAINDGQLPVEEAQNAIERLNPMFDRILNDASLPKSDLDKADREDCIVEIGLLYRSAQKYNEAISYFQDSIKTSPSAPAYYQISSIYKEQGNIRKAIEYAETLMNKPELFENMDGDRKDRYYVYLIDLYVEADRRNDARRIFDSLSPNSLSRLTLPIEYPFLN